MGLLDEFIEEIGKDKVEEENKEKEQQKNEGNFDGQYSSQFLEYVKKTSRWGA